MIGRRLRTARWLAALLLSAGLIYAWVHRITGAPIEDDAAQTVLMALNVERHGVMSLEENPPLNPTNYREPLPVFASALAIKLVDAALGEAPPEAYFHGRRVQLLKYQNIVWLSLLSIGAFSAVSFFTSSFALALVGTLLVNLPYLRNSADLVDDLYNDIPGAAVFMLASVAIAVAFRRRSPAFWALAGLLFGILTLIKAATLYVFAGTAAMAGAVYLWQRLPFRSAARDLGVMIVAFGCAVAPWMYRNQVQLGSAHIAQRAGAPDKTLTYYRQARAERVKLEHEMVAVGQPQPEIAADDLLKARAMRIVLDHPWRNLALTVPYLWRGATLAFPILVVALLAALRLRRYDFLLFVVPAFGTVMLYALFTHFIARYDLPALSIATVALVVLVRLALQARAPVGRSATRFNDVLHRSIVKCQPAWTRRCLTPIG